MKSLPVNISSLQVKILYIRNLALCTTEDDIRNLCMNVGGVERVKKQKDYAFVHFSTREQAERIKADLNGELNACSSFYTKKFWIGIICGGRGFDKRDTATKKATHFNSSLNNFSL